MLLGGGIKYLFEASFDVPGPQCRIYNEAPTYHAPFKLPISFYEAEGPLGPLRVCVRAVFWGAE